MPRVIARIVAGPRIIMLLRVGWWRTGLMLGRDERCGLLWRMRCRSLDDLVQFAAIQPDTAAFGAVIDLDPLALGHDQVRVVDGAFLGPFLSMRGLMARGSLAGPLRGVRRSLRQRPEHSGSGFARADAARIVGTPPPRTGIHDPPGTPPGGRAPRPGRPLPMRLSPKHQRVRGLSGAIRIGGL